MMQALRYNNFDGRKFHGLVSYIYCPACPPREDQRGVNPATGAIVNERLKKSTLFAENLLAAAARIMKGCHQQTIDGVPENSQLPNESAKKFTNSAR